MWALGLASSRHECFVSPSFFHRFSFFFRIMLFHDCVLSQVAQSSASPLCLNNQLKQLAQLIQHMRRYSYASFGMWVSLLLPNSAILFVMPKISVFLRIFFQQILYRNCLKRFIKFVWQHFFQDVLYLIVWNALSLNECPYGFYFQFGCVFRTRSICTPTCPSWWPALAPLATSDWWRAGSRLCGAPHTCCWCSSLATGRPPPSGPRLTSSSTSARATSASGLPIHSIETSWTSTC